MVTCGCRDDALAADVAAVTDGCGTIGKTPAGKGPKRGVARGDLCELAGMLGLVKRQPERGDSLVDAHLRRRREDRHRGAGACVDPVDDLGV